MLAAKSTLLFVAGATPQIITETVYCLLAGEVSATIHVLTTRTGKRAIEERLLGPQGSWRRFQREYPAARRFGLSRERVVVLRDAVGRPLLDVRSRDDNEAAADQIAEAVARLTDDGRPPLHASIAGGRKTMGYALAAAMMLYGRREDRLSHVLVHPPELEGSDFFYPARVVSRTLVCRLPRGRTVKVRAKDVKVELADLPFPRLRGIRGMSALREKTFSRLVAELQADLDALAEPSVVVRFPEGLIFCGGRHVPLTPVRSAIYSLLAERRRDGCSDADCPGCPRCCLPAAEVDREFAAALGHRLRSGPNPSWGVGRSWNRQRFRQEVSKINHEIDKVLRGASAPYRIRSTGLRRGRLYGIAAPRSAIRIESLGPA
jgi:CRISPR-associated protein (TIGR02584 family)